MQMIFPQLNHSTDNFLSPSQRPRLAVKVYLGYIVKTYTTHYTVDKRSSQRQSHQNMNHYSYVIKELRIPLCSIE